MSSLLGLLDVEELLPLAVALPLGGAAIALVAHRRLTLQRRLSVAVVGVTLLLSCVLLAAASSNGAVATTLGGWPAPLGISLLVDVFSGLILVVSMATVFGVLLFAISQLGRIVEARYFHPLYLVLTAGVALSFLTADLFNLFVAFEVTLIASYVLLTLGAPRAAIRPAMTYVVVNLLSSTVFITALGLVYAATGTVAMADLAGRVGDLPEPLQGALALLFLAVFGVKAAIFPLFFWLPDSYPAAPTSITAVFAGLLTKVGVYSMIRTQTIVFGRGADGPDPLVLTIAGATMVVGVLGAIAQNDMKRILSFHIVSQIGYMVFGLGLYSVLGLAAATLYIVHHVPVKTSLFLVGGLVEDMTGTSALSRTGGLARRAPLTAGLFGLAALSLAGLPPFSGFFGKLALVQAGVAAQQWVIVGVSLFVSVLTLFSMTKIWGGVFWGAPEELPPKESARGDHRLAAPRLMTGATVGMVALTLCVAAAAEPLWQLSLRAGEALTDPGAYVDAVYAPET